MSDLDEDKIPQMNSEETQIYLRIQETLRLQREKYAEDVRKLSILDGLKRTVNLLADLFNYGLADHVYDFSKWNSDTNGNTFVDWNGLGKNSRTLGGYCKIGQPFTTANPMTKEADVWFDRSWNSNFSGMVKSGLFAAGYIFHQSAWYLDKGITVNSLNAIWDGTIQEVCTKLLKSDPHLYIAGRTMRPGVGRVFDASRIKDFADWNGDEIIWDVEYPYKVNNQPIDDGWFARSVKLTLDGAKFLMDNGCLPKHHQVIYTSNYVIQSWGNVYLRDVVARWDTICAGYYYNSKDGYKFCKTVDDIISLLATWSTSWHPIHVGAGVPGKIVLMYQVMENLTTPFVGNGMGGYGAMDLNVSRLSRDSFRARYPKYAKRADAFSKQESDTDPEEQNPVKKYFLTVKNAAHNLRRSPTTSSDDIGDIAKGTKLEVTPSGPSDGYSWYKVEGFVAETPNIKIEEE